MVSTQTHGARVMLTFRAAPTLYGAVQQTAVTNHVWIWSFPLKPNELCVYHLNIHVIRALVRRECVLSKHYIRTRVCRLFQCEIMCDDATKMSTLFSTLRSKFHSSSRLPRTQQYTHTQTFRTYHRRTIIRNYKLWMSIPQRLCNIWLRLNNELYVLFELYS